MSGGFFLGESSCWDCKELLQKPQPSFNLWNPGGGVGGVPGPRFPRRPFACTCQAVGEAAFHASCVAPRSKPRISSKEDLGEPCKPPFPEKAPEGRGEKKAFALQDPSWKMRFSKKGEASVVAWVHLHNLLIECASIVLRNPSMVLGG